MLPRYGRWAQTYGPQGLEVIGVHTPETSGESDEGALRTFVRGRGVRWRVVPDNDSAAWDRFAIEAWPTAVLIDREGVLRGVYMGDDRDGDIAADIKRLLAAGKRR